MSQSKGNGGARDSKNAGGAGGSSGANVNAGSGSEYRYPEDLTLSDLEITLRAEQRLAVDKKNHKPVKSQDEVKGDVHKEAKNALQRRNFLKLPQVSQADILGEARRQQEAAAEIAAATPEPIAGASPELMAAAARAQALSAAGVVKTPNTNAAAATPVLNDIYNGIMRERANSLSPQSARVGGNITVTDRVQPVTGSLVPKTGKTEVVTQTGGVALAVVGVVSPAIVIATVPANSPQMPPLDLAAVDAVPTVQLPATQQPAPTTDAAYVVPPAPRHAATAPVPAAASDGASAAAASFSAKTPKAAKPQPGAGTVLAMMAAQSNARTK